ncbi:MAG: xylulokinase [Clostridia bacterium]|nr:xylulokinase [Clostridia bacterium]
MKYLLGIDIGTSGTKTILFDEAGNGIASATAEYPLYQPQNGWAEQDPEDWWNAVTETTAAVVQKCGVAKEDIVSIGLSGQMHGLVLLDENCRVLRKAILWCDGRTTAQCREIENRLGREKLIEITANPALEGFTAGKILWVQENEPELWTKVRHILLPKDYIRYKLAGTFATDASDASGMQLLHIANRDWSEEVCAALDIDMTMLPKVYESPDVTGGLLPEAADAVGLCAGIPIAGGGGDNACAAIGTGVCREGKAFTTIGTSGVVFAHTKDLHIDKKGRIHTFCCAVPGAWHVMGCTLAAGLSLNWFRSQLASEYSYPELDRACENLPIGADDLIYLPYLMGERSPILDARSRGVFFGLSAIHTKAHMARAVMEGVAYSLYDCLEVLRENDIECSDMAFCGGGAKSDFWREMFTDVYGVPVKLMQSSEGAVLGAAILGGCAAGVYTSVEEGCDRAVRDGASCQPDADRHGQYMRYYGIYRKLYPALKDAYAALHP